jgi:hypothetical protein
MLNATHINYKHPRHLRAVDGARVLCVSPSSSDYARLNRKTLRDWSASADADARIGSEKT